MEMSLLPDWESQTFPSPKLGPNAVFTNRSPPLQCKPINGLPLQNTLKPQHHRLLRRTFIAAKIKWVRDPYLDEAVSKEKNLKPLLALKTLILSAPSKTLPAAVAAVRLTPQAIALHNEELAVHASPERLQEAAERLAKLLMLAGARRLPLRIVDCFRFDLGLPDNYITGICCDFPEYFQISSGNDPELLDLELVSWRENLACSVLEKRAMNGNSDIRKGMRIAFPMFFSRGFDLQKKVKDWLDEWQNLPYISPYENGFHLNPNSDQAEKWAVAVLHELLSLMVSKKTERDNIFCLGEYLGFGSRFKKALVRYAGIFYVSNKIKTHTVVLREAYRKDFLLENHPLMGMRHRYIHLMNKSEKMRYQNADFLNKSKQDCKGDCKLENQAVSCGRRVSGRTG
ncbi:Protein WHAT'S THIS FACTOR 1 [Vitis vinifera]|uniref:Protein WHAT'S THIS FACTOR 1 n=1 Tax=Vitis vinifera TaxID=29760 RepID=A0A438GFI5_VITVI|nr:Protein WHAT'S THIS FACTOR 1 [Vitis vinifera]